MQHIVFIRTSHANIQSLRNAVYSHAGIIENSYGGNLLGVCYVAEPLNPCSDERDEVDCALALIKFPSRDHAALFLQVAGYLEVNFLPDCDIFMVPLLKAVKLGPCWPTFLITELGSRDNYQYLPSRNKLYQIDDFGGVPVLADTSYVDAVRKHRCLPAGIRIHQFKDKQNFDEWLNSKSGAEFKQDYRRISGLNTYLATFF
ncbi:unnamed protein product [Rodentolepis nana]|uniref:Glycosyltransferase n=1 Tax=Rodentolepis nana TaxID=102285 RepID=A0A0R3TU33_RODNA|nr:unnamed protein product [Rodentolepis nana]